jgi:hypothetical protein
MKIGISIWSWMCLWIDERDVGDQLNACARIFLIDCG